jgi:hypothetical protein
MTTRIVYETGEANFTATYCLTSGFLWEFFFVRLCVILLLRVSLVIVMLVFFSISDRPFSDLDILLSSEQTEHIN